VLLLLVNQDFCTQRCIFTYEGYNANGTDHLSYSCAFEDLSKAGSIQSTSVHLTSRQTDNVPINDARMPRKLISELKSVHSESFSESRLDIILVNLKMSNGKLREYLDDTKPIKVVSFEEFPIHGLQSKEQMCINKWTKYHPEAERNCHPSPDNILKSISILENLIASLAEQIDDLETAAVPDKAILDMRAHF